MSINDIQNKKLFVEKRIKVLSDVINIFYNFLLELIIVNEVQEELKTNKTNLLTSYNMTKDI